MTGDGRVCVTYEFVADGGSIRLEIEGDALARLTILVGEI